METRKTEGDRGEETRPAGARKLCPLARDPREECYCYDLTSQNIEAAITYCAGNHDKCGTYRRLHATKVKESSSEREQKGG